MKRLLAVFLAMILMLSLCSCADKNTDKDDKEETKETQAQQATAPQTDEETVAEQTNEKIDVESFFKDDIDLSLYTKGTDSYYIDDVTYNFEENITVDSKNFSIPCDYSELINAGFKFNGDDTTEIEGFSTTKTVTGSDAIAYNCLKINLSTTDSKRFGVYVYNMSEQAKPLNTGSVYNFNFDVETAPDFVYSNLTADSTVADIVKELGNPSSITAYSNSVTLSFLNSDNKYVRVSIDENQKITSFTVNML